MNEPSCICNGAYLVVVRVWQELAMRKNSSYSVRTTGYLYLNTYSFFYTSSTVHSTWKNIFLKTGVENYKISSSELYFSVEDQSLKTVFFYI